ncbi:PREDICTED: trafficking protein particle complex subunit 8 isoform X1 [Theobroma cacao]|uniref:Trafficking protein particle complex subunit 8 isoform X1 n=2 Tax=Theobroma cacao TaxID=3641 RepID=A0AB32V434_THECC|nr:PREDICTED: trafficking protein particle complex subunit 8 isoform X1 [Theobroma cacao]
MVDPANTPLGKMLLEEITPVVMVLCTPLVEESCLKNGLSFIQMLSPFCNFTNIDVPVRTASDQPYRLQKFKLRLFYASDIRQPNLEVAKERLKQVITQAGEKDFSEMWSDPPQVNDLLSRPESEILPSWFQFFNEELVRTLSFSDHEAFDHPVACLLVVSSRDEEPINRFVDLFNTNKLPSLLNDGAMDPKILKHYLLVHDNQDGASEKATKLLTEMKSTFGPNDCQLLCINSSQDRQIHHQENPWAPFKSDALPTENLGCFLNFDDFNEIKDLMQELSSKHIIPYMEQKIRVLNQQVSATRKGFRNQIKNLWWRKGKEDASDSPNGPVYTFSSVESQIRILGDYAFMLRDYELALSNYRLISTDYKLDKAWKRYAGVQEMMGLTYFLLDQSRKEAEYCMENAFNTYLKLGSAGQQNATRCGLWWVEMLKTRDQIKEAATVYFRICSEDPLHSAVMLEQASFCYLLSKPPMLHKYGFHLVLSGDHYKKCDQVSQSLKYCDNVPNSRSSNILQCFHLQIKHAIRTYRSAVSVYKGTTWSLIKDHVHFHIGQWYAFLGMYDVAVTHMLELLACSHQSKTTQELFLRDFLQIVQKTGKTFEVLKLQLPAINISSLKVIFEDHRTYASAAAASVKESVWHSLEEDMIPSLSTAKSNWLELQSKLMPKKYKESNICVAGEAIKVDVEFKNPLQISISILSVSLICELSANLEEMNSDGNGSNIELQNDENKTSTSTRDIDSSSILSEVDLSLEGGETTLVQLTVTPRVEGILKIVGVKWKLSSSVVGFHNFESNSLNKNVAKGRRKAKYSPDNYLKFIVIKSLPKLEGIIHSLPEKTYVGDLRHLVLELSNRSKFPVKNLKMKISNPRFLNAGNQRELNVEFPACLGKKTNVVQSGGHSNINKVLQNVFLFPENISVQEETSLSWPLWFRAAVPGNISLYVTIYYEMEDVSSIMKYRTLRMHYNLQVSPSLDVSFELSPCPSRLQEFLLRMDVVNKTSSECFQVHQLSSVGKQWEISLLQPVDSILPSQSLFAGQALSCFFKLKDRRKSSTSEDSIPSPSLLLQSDVRLGPQGNSEALFDVYSSPLADFHNSERLHQGMPLQGNEYKVDFVFISQLLKGNIDSGAPNTPLLISHHACHCSLSSMSSISWLVDGPQTVQHNFSGSLCEVNLRMMITNSSDAVASVRISTFDSPSSSIQSSDASAPQPGLPPEIQAGWCDIPVVNDMKVITSDALATRFTKSVSLESVSQFIWSGSSSTKLRLQPRSTAEIPLQISVFAPGIYDLSNYVLNWNLMPSSEEEKQGEASKSSGVCQGYPYYLTVVQST